MRLMSALHDLRQELYVGSDVGNGLGAPEFAGDLSNN